MKHPATIFFSSAHPLFAVFNFEFVEMSADLLSIKFNPQKEFVARKETGQLHSGYSTLILDSVMGGAVMGSLDQIQPIATINLTTQHSHRAVIDDAVICTAQVERIEDEIAVVTGQVIAVKSQDVLATAVGSFMIGTRSIPLDQKSGAGK